MLEEARDAALVAGDARVDLLQPPVSRLVRPVRVRQQRAADGDEVRTARGDDLVRQRGVADLAHRDDRHADGLLHALGEREQHAVLARHRRHHVAACVRRVVAHRDVERRHAQLLQPPRDDDGVVRRDAAGHQLIAGQPDDEREVRRHGALHRLDDLDQETHPVLEWTAVRVVTLVRER